MEVRLKELDAAIAEQSAKLAGLKTENVPYSPTVEVLSPELASALWVLSSGFQEACNLVGQGSLAAGAASITKMSSKAAEFDTRWPKSLLGADMARQLDNLKERQAETVHATWEQALQITNSSIRLENTENAEFVALTFVNLREAALRAIEPCISGLLNLTSAKFTTKDDILQWENLEETSVQGLTANVRCFVEYMSCHAPPTLAAAVSSRYGVHLVSTLVRTSIPQLLGSDRTEAESQLKFIEQLQPTLTSTGYSKSPELTQFVAGFDATWTELQRRAYLAKLREIYLNVGSLDDAKRASLVKPNDDEGGDGDGDGWDWNEDEEEAEEEENATTNDNGLVVNLWNQYAAEVTDGKPFITLYRALVPDAYEENHLWIYADTLAFASHISGSNSTALRDFAGTHLQQYIRQLQLKFERSLLPNIFGPQSNFILSQIAESVDAIAVATNDVGGLDLRQEVLSRVVEQSAVHVITTITKIADIGEEDSQEFAAIIAKLMPLAVYFTDVNASVPSWNKLEMLKQILNSNLAAIQEMHRQYMLLDFSKQELTDLVMALFIDSSLRQEVRREINEAR